MQVRSLAGPGAGTSTRPSLLITGIQTRCIPPRLFSSSFPSLARPPPRIYTPHLAAESLRAHTRTHIHARAGGREREESARGQREATAVFHSVSLVLSCLALFCWLIHQLARGRVFGAMLFTCRGGCRARARDCVKYSAALRVKRAVGP